MSDKKRQRNQDYFTARPKEVSFLLAKGFVPKNVPNPWNPTKSAWLFPGSTDLFKAVDDYNKGEEL